MTRTPVVIVFASGQYGNFPGMKDLAKLRFGGNDERLVALKSKYGPGEPAPDDRERGSANWGRPARRPPSEDADASGTRSHWIGA